MKMKKIVALVMTLVLVLSFAGCGEESQIGFFDETIEEAMEKPYEINWYFYANSQGDVEVVEEKINEYLKDKINATVKLNILESSQYSNQLTSMIQAGEYFDICFVASWMLKYTESANMGAFIPLDDYFDEYMPKTYELSDMDALECSKVKGKLYALPIIKENSENYGWIYRKDIADKYNIDMTKIKSFEELEPYLEMIKENEPDIEYPIDWDMDLSPSGGILKQHVLAANVIGLVNDGSDEVINLLSSDEKREAMRVAHRFYKKGLVKEDILTSSSELNSRMRAGKTFCHMNKLKPGKAQELYKDTDEFKFAQADVTEAKKVVGMGKGSMMAVSSTSKNPARVMRFIELLNTDEYLNNLVVHGVEGIHYEKKADGRIEQKSDSKYSLAEKQWMIANVYLTYPTIEEDANKNEKLKAYDESAAPNLLTGFSFVTDDVETELASCAAVDKQYRSQLVLGAIDPDSIYDKYMEEMEKAGMNTIIDEVQRQLDEFLKNKK